MVRGGAALALLVADVDGDLAWHGRGGQAAWWLVLVDSDAEGIRESSNAITRLTFAASNAIALPSVGAPLSTTLDSLGDLAAAAEKANRDALPAVLVGRAPLELTDEQRDGLRAYLDAGGFLIALSADYGFSLSALEGLAEALPGLETSVNLAALRANDDLPYQPAAPQARALTLDGELVGVVLGRSYLEAWSAAPTDDTNVAYELGVNILAHVLQSAWRTAVAAPVAEE